MRKAIRILEIPIYLLVIALCIHEIEGVVGIPIFLVIVSVARLITNTMFDKNIYKK